MKKFLPIFFAAFLASNYSYATGLFIGADALYSDVRHHARNSSTTSGPNNNALTKGKQSGYGVNTGARFDLLMLLASGELFYDDLNISSNQFASSTNSGDRVKVKDRYGLKLNAGFAILPKVTPFLTLGLSNTRYDINGITADSARSKNELTPLYGVGLLIDLPLGISLKAAYDYQSYRFNSPSNPAKIRTHLGVARLGIVYNF